MYQKPDFIKVSVKANDVFAPYGTTGCPEDVYGYWSYTGTNCKDTDGYKYVEQPYTSLGVAAYQCYSSLNP